MFIEMLKKRNPALISAGYQLHQSGLVEPNSYIVDLDMLSQNAGRIANKAKELDLSVFAMTKQLGRNPVVCSTIVNSGIDRFVSVDPWEARKLASGGFNLGNVGHLVQIPKGMLGEILSYNPDFITVYSYDNALLINEIAHSMGKVQKLILRINHKASVYPGQEGGISINELPVIAENIRKLGNVTVSGVTAFPCVLFNKEKEQFELTSAAEELKRACEILKDRGFEIEAVNVPSANACASMPLVKACSGNYIEPGHALSGTTPAHACTLQPEIPALLYLTEVSHKDGGYAYVYGGGNYSRGNVLNALAGSTEEALMDSFYKFRFPPESNIDYYGKLSNASDLPVGTTVMACFRTQIFVTRAKVVPVSGIQSGKPVIEGVFDALGNDIS